MSAADEGLDVPNADPRAVWALLLSGRRCRWWRKSFYPGLFETRAGFSLAAF